MDKKKIIIIAAVVVVVIFLYMTSKDKSFEDMMDSLEGTVAGKTGKDAQEHVRSSIVAQANILRRAGLLSRFRKLRITGMLFVNI